MPAASSPNWPTWSEDLIDTFSTFNPVVIFFMFFAANLACLCGRRRRGGSKEVKSVSVDQGSEPPTHVLWEFGRATSPSLSASSTADVHPAYSNKQEVEYFSAAQGKWIIAEADARIVAATSSSKSQDVLYSITVKSRGQHKAASAVIKHGVSLDLLREPLRPGEHCEVFMAFSNSWEPAQVGTAGRRPPLEHIMYAVKHTQDIGSSGALSEYRGSLIRRRFMPGNPCEVYLGAEVGWSEAAVAAGLQEPLQGTEKESPEPSQVYWKLVPVQVQGSGAMVNLPSFLIRPAAAHGTGCAEHLLALKVDSVDSVFCI